MSNPPEVALPLRHQFRVSSTYTPANPNHAQTSFLVTSFVKLVPFDWMSDIDPANPRNWNTAAKVCHTLIPALFTFVVILATSIYVPAIPYVMEEFEVPSTVAVLGLSLYMFGVTIGSTLGGPASEMAGRKPVYLVSLPIFMGFTIASASVQSLVTLLICRFIAGLGGSLCIAVGGGSISDIWEMNSTGILASLLYVLMPFLAPSLGPLTGAYIISDREDWHWSLWIMAIIAAPIYFAAAFMHETFKDVILRSRFENLGLGFQMPVEVQARNSIWITVSRTLHMLLIEPTVLFLALYTSLGYAIIFVCFDVFPTIFAQVYGLDDKKVGLTFLSLLVGFVLALLSFVLLSAITAKRAAKSGSSCPERHMHCALLGSLMLPASLFWLASTCKSSVHWIVPVLACVPFAWSTLDIFLSALLYIMVVYPPQYTASAMAALGVLRYTFGAVFPLFANQMYMALGVRWTFVLLGGISTVLLPVPWILTAYGKPLRKRSTYDASQG